MTPPHPHATAARISEERMLNRLALVLAVALVAGTVAVLALAAASRAYGRPGAAILIALTAVFLAQGITPLIRNRNR